MSELPDAVLIVNPTAGRGQAGRRIRDVNNLLRQSGLAGTVWRHTRARGDAEQLARQAAGAGVPLVVAVGGDGTIGEVANGIMGSEATLGLIPFGTGNDLARALGLYGDLERACGALTQGVTQRVDVGWIEGAGFEGGRHFLVLAGTGFDACTARTVNQGIRFLSGAPAYLVGALVTLAQFIPFQLTLGLDEEAGQHTRAMFVSVANTATTGGGMRIAPGADVSDGALDICLVRPVPKTEFVVQLAHVFQGNHVRHQAVTMRRARRVTLEADPPQPLLIDGEVLGTTPATITLRPQALAVRVPPP